MINIDRFGISTSSSLQGTSHEKNSEEAYVSQVNRRRDPTKKRLGTLPKK
jgi:hypothetical protein